MQALLQDVRYAVRTFAGNRAPTVVAILMLALGIGANTAIFSVVEGVVLRSLPFRDPERLVSILLGFDENRAEGKGGSTLPFVVYEAWRAGSTRFEDLGAHIGDQPILTGFGSAERITATMVTSNLFPLVGAHPMLGRTFLPQEDRPGTAPVVVLSHSFWATRFGSDPNVLGRTMTLDGIVYEVIGVMPSGFEFPLMPVGFKSSGSQVWGAMGPFLHDPAVKGGRTRSWGCWVIGRLKPGVSIAQAEAELDVVTKRLREGEPRLQKFLPVIAPLQNTVVGSLRRPLFLVLGAVSLVLLIACANVANLLLARAVARRREMAIRIALGASRWRLVRQLLTESILLALVGGLLGIALATWGVSALIALAGRELPRVNEIGVNLRVLAVTLGATVLTGILFGLAPALQAALRVSAPALKEGSAGGGASAWRNRASDAFIVAQVALTMVLLTGAGLLARSFSRLVNVDTGFQAEHIITAQFLLPQLRYSTDTQRIELTRRLLERASVLPGVSVASISTGTPLAGGAFTTLRAEGKPEREHAPPAWIAGVTPGYFRAFGIPLLRGQLFRADAALDAIIVDEALVRQHFPNEDPIGKRVVFYGSTVGTIIGVVGNTRQRSLDAPPPPHIYRPYASAAASYLKLVVRASADPAPLGRSIRRVFHDIDANLPIDQLATMREMISESLTRQRFYATLLGIFAACALVMAAAGVYSIVTYAVTRRTPELGIRIALGAGRRHVLGLVLSRGLALAMMGIALGAAGSLAATRLLRTFLFEVTPTDPVVFGGVALLLGAMALLASYLPGRRATRIDPMIALRAE